MFRDIKWDLDEARNEMNSGDWHAADVRVNELIEEIGVGALTVSEDQENCLYAYLDKISEHYYGNDRTFEDSIWNVFN